MGARPKVVALNPRIDERDDAVADPPQSHAMDPVPCDVDAGLDQGGVIDGARHVNQRMKAFTYGRTRVDRAWKERFNASGQTSTFSCENSNTAHFLDITEFTDVFDVGCNWLYDSWADPTGKTFGLPSSTSASKHSQQMELGLPRRLCHGGSATGALAILGDDNTNTAGRLS
ncbi:hypothetical protein FS837_001371, partial [Tulasnella sp. UAMH 9824]